MDSTLDAKPTDPRDVFARVNEEIARAYEQIALADEQLSKMAHHAARHPPAAVKDGQVRGHRPSFGGRAVRAFTGLLLAACIGAAAIAWQSSYGDAAKEIVAKWAPQLVLTSSPPLQKPGLPGQSSPAAVQVSASEAAPPQPAAPAQIAPEGIAPTAAAVSAELTQLSQSTARALATVEQEIEQIKASIEQLKASQQEMSRDIAKVSEQTLRPAIPAPPPRPAAAPARKPMPPFPPPRAAAAPRLPQAAGPSVPR